MNSAGTSEVCVAVSVCMLLTCPFVAGAATERIGNLVIVLLVFSYCACILYITSSMAVKDVMTE